jgi:predicted hotdog family 3-hydroxylacyl-ACP dehydratase
MRYDGPIADLLPHRGTMLLVERLLEEEAEAVRVQATVRREQPFVREDGLPAWAGIELMAQAIGTWAGLQRLRRGEKVQLGFLVGTRRYDCAVPVFAIGERLEVTARLELLADNGLAVFVCAIWRGGELAAQAQLNVFQPHDVERYLREGTP